MVKAAIYADQHPSATLCANSHCQHQTTLASSHRCSANQVFSDFLIIYCVCPAVTDVLASLNAKNHFGFF